MRTFRLAKIAAEAEGLRLRQQFHRRINQAIWGAVAAVFAICALAVAHFAAWLGLVMLVAPVWAALILLGIDVVIAAVLGFLATRSSPGRVEQEAIVVRDQAKQQLAITAATATFIGPVARALGLRSLSSLVIGALATRYLSKPQ